MAGLLDVVRASGHFDNALPENMGRIRYFGAERIEAPKTRKPDGNQVSFFDLVDGCWEDLDRLSGSALEMESVVNGAGSWQAHLELLWLETVPDEATIAWFSCAHQEHLAA
ncbi:hypothetical protein [Aquitalea sp. ASV15]|uniref:hypothetical protein n=1 Tax=Aquitalea sp. ASV15 TaxID=2795104 RepID=UPI0018EC6A07|nr:hypothetical protein [Aquitalea sp. ASV15]